jgi:hypothetical protein
MKIKYIIGLITLVIFSSCTSIYTIEEEVDSKATMDTVYYYKAVDKDGISSMWKSKTKYCKGEKIEKW